MYIKDKAKVSAYNKAYSAANAARISAAGKARWASRKETIKNDVSRVCLSCKLEKPITDFYLSYRTRCKKCLKAQSSQTPKEKSAYVRAWKAKNTEKVQAWLESNRLHRLNYAKELYAKNDAFRARKAQYFVEWYKQNRHVTNAHRAKYHAKLLRATPAWANQDAIKKIYKEAVRLTLETGIKHEVDHIYPLRSKLVCGLHWEANLQVLTKAENRRKSARLPESIAC